MWRLRNWQEAHSFCCLFLAVLAAVLFQALWASSIATPSSNCYAFDNSSHIYDFSSWIGQPFEYEGKDSDFVVRFCKDVESRSQTGYVDFGRFDKFNYFVAGSGHINFVQEFFNGDLMNCEKSYDKMGRTSQVNVICGSCLNGQCKVTRGVRVSGSFRDIERSKFCPSHNWCGIQIICSGGLGCICNVTYESACRVLVELAIPCEKQGLRVFEGFTVGFHPRSWEVVYNGMTQLGFEKSYPEFSFGTEQTHVVLYMTAVASLSSLVQKPIIKVFPEHGLEVRLSGPGATGSPPTTLSPTMLIVDWRCEKARATPYEVLITIPVESYEPIQFTLTKMCEYRQDEGGDTMRRWATFGVFSCIFIVFSTLFCCGGFVYKTRVQNQRGLDALPGMAIFSACLETVNGGGHGYLRSEDANSPFVNQASWERPPVSAQGSRGTSERNYGSI